MAIRAATTTTNQSPGRQWSVVRARSGFWVLKTAEYIDFGQLVTGHTTASTERQTSPENRFLTLARLRCSGGLLTNTGFPFLDGFRQSRRARGLANQNVTDFVQTPNPASHGAAPMPVVVVPFSRHTVTNTKFAYGVG